LVRVALARLSLKGLKHASSGALDHRAWLSADEEPLVGADDVMIRAPARPDNNVSQTRKQRDWSPRRDRE
jgi:hypothetical protein